jgi:hypothetical protein
VVRLHGILAVAKVQVPVKAKLWVRELVPVSEGKHVKTILILPHKKKAHLPLNILSQNFTTTP